MKLENKIVYVTMMVTTSILLSCTDSDSLLPVKTSTLEYLNLKVGNYWLYNESKTDTNTGITTTYTDSVVVVGMQVLNTKEYFVLAGHTVGTKHFRYTFLRDSANHIVDRYGNILLTNTTTDGPIQTVSQTIGSSNYTIVTSAHRETGLTINNISFNDLLNLRENITFRKASEPTQTFKNDNQYANGVGLVRQTRKLLPTGTIVERVIVKWGTN